MRKKTSLIALLCLASSEVYAQEGDVIVVTATQTEQSIQDVDASIEVITREDIQRFSGRSTIEVLQHSTGISITDSGSSSNVSVRGFDSKHTLILVDGMRRTEKYAGANLNNISLENIERIEVVRGPMSALYGSDALGGVINIITRTASKNTTRVRVNVGATTQGDGRETRLVHLSKDIKHDHSSHSFGLEYKDRNPYTGENGFLNKEQRTFANYRGLFNIDESQDLQLGVEYLKQNDKNAVEASGRFELDERYTLTSQYTHRLESDQLNIDVSYGESDSLVNRGTGNESTDFRQAQIELRYAGFLGENHLYNIGMGYRHDDADISINSRNAQRNIAHLYAQDQWEITDQLQLTGGVRFDKYSDFGNSFNPRFSLSWEQGTWKLRAGYGKAFGAPSFLEMYTHFSRGRGSVIIQGNPDLRPEESETAEVSIRRQFAFGHTELTAYHSEVDQLIDYTTERIEGTCPRCTTYMRANNIDRAVLKGIEISNVWALANNHHLNFSLEYQDVRDANSKQRLTGRARMQSKVSLNSSWSDKFTTSLRSRYIDDFYNNTGRSTPRVNSNLLTVDLSANYRINNQFEWFMGVNNVFNKEPSPNMNFRGIPQDPGSRYFYTGVALGF